MYKAKYLIFVLKHRLTPSASPCIDITVQGTNQTSWMIKLSIWLNLRELVQKSIYARSFARETNWTRRQTICYKSKYSSVSVIIVIIIIFV